MVNSTNNKQIQFNFFLNIFIQPLSRDAARNKLRFTDMNVDCLSLIFDELPLKDLISLAKINNRHIRFAVDDIARGKIIHKDVVFFDPINPVFSCDLNEYDTLIQVINFDRISNFLECFGRFISYLSIRFDCRDRRYSESEMHDIFRLVNLHCSESLFRLTIETMVANENTFQTFTKPFRNVRKLSVDGRCCGYLNFNEIFPSVSDLTLLAKVIYNDRLEFLDQVIPNLQNLSITHHQAPMKPAIKNFIKLNCHIRSLEFIHFSPAHLSFIAEELPHLEKLLIYTDGSKPTAEQVVNFEHLRSFTIYTFELFSPNMIFKDLEELHVMCGSQNADRFVSQVIKYEANLKNVSLNIELTNTELQRLSEADLKVIELLIQCTKHVGTDYIIRIIENNKQLVKFVINWGDYFSDGGSAPNELKNHFENNDNWLITETHRSLIFERRNDV